MGRLGSVVCCCRKKKEPPLQQSQASSSSLRVLAAQTLKIASINGLGDTDKLETELEDEIQWEESRSQPSEVVDRVRRRCEEIVHSKSMLLFVVLLNVIDCILVMGELTMDFHHVSYLFISQREHKNEFVGRMNKIYSYKQLQQEPVTDLYNSLLSSFIFWNATYYTQELLQEDCSRFSTVSGNHSAGLLTSFMSWMTNFSSYDNQQVMGEVTKEAYDTTKVAHILHYASISILCVLVVETLLKMLCTGLRFFRKRMEVFDALIILISFVLDIIFVEGLTDLKIQNFVVILSFLLPWRILRVLNSLVVAVMDQHRFHMKLLYKQKRKVTKQLSESTDKIRVLEKQVEVLKAMCIEKGANDWEVKKALGQNQNGSSGLAGMNALSKLVFQAADAFAPMSRGQLNGRVDSDAGSSSSKPQTPQNKHFPRHSATNGAAHGAGRVSFGGAEGGGGKTAKVSFGTLDSPRGSEGSFDTLDNDEAQIEGAKDFSSDALDIDDDKGRAESFDTLDLERDLAEDSKDNRRHSRSSLGASSPRFYVPNEEPVTVEVIATLGDDDNGVSTRL